MRVAALFPVFLLLLSVAIISPISAKQKIESNDSDIPEQNGDFKDPANSNLRVRVFVHKFKNQSLTAVACDDPDSTAIVPAAGWKLSSGNWTYNLNPSSTPSSVGSSNLSTVAANGFATWQTAENKVNFVQGPATTKDRSSLDGKNIIAWGRTSSGTLGVTYIRYYPSTGLVVDVDTILNKRVPWAWNGGSSTTCGDPKRYDAQDILTHEQGHWLGLDDTYDASFVNNTMYGYGSLGETKKDSLTSGDIAGIAAIYP